MTILLVVMNHIRLLDLSTGECYQFVYDINRCFEPLRMPTFIAVSGALLYYSRISRGWRTADLYKDKLVRLGMPLLFCTLLGNGMQMLFNSFVKHPHEVTISSFLRSFVLTDNLPWPHRWYLMTLALIMALYPLFAIKKSKWLEVATLIILFVLKDFDFAPDELDNWFGLFTLNAYIPYFYLGLLAFKHEWYRYLSSWGVTIVLVLSYCILYASNLVPTIDFLSSYTPFYEVLGMTTIVSISMQIDRLCPRAFKSYSGYIFQIYLFGIAFQAFVELILWRAIGCPNALVIPVYILNIICGLYLPVAMSLIIKRIPIRWIRLCFGLK